MSIDIRRPRVLVALLPILSLAIGLSITLELGESVSAHPIGWYWDDGNVTPQVKNNTSSYGIQISSAISDYNGNTDLTVWSCSSGCNIIHSQANWGNTGWIARALPYSGGTICVNSGTGIPTGYCNTTNHKVDFGYVDWNDDYGTSQPHFIARHEMGHLFGLAHTDCTYFSVMQAGVCNPFPASLTNHDRADINAMY